MRPATLPHHRTCGFPHPAVERGRVAIEGSQGRLLGFAASGSLRLHRFCSSRSEASHRSCDVFEFQNPWSRPQFLSLASLFFSPSLQPRYRPSSLLRPLLSSPPLSWRRPPRVRCRICPLVPHGSTLHVLDDLLGSLFPASLPPAPGLTAVSCSYGREFAIRFFQLHLTATPCGFATVAAIGPDWLLHPIRFCPCRAHWGSL